MHEERALSQVNRAFRDGSLADRAILALAKAGASQRLDEDDRASLVGATEFLRRAMEGYEWYSTPRISPQSKASAGSFETAVQTRYPDRAPTRFREDLEEMLATLRKLVEVGQPVPSPESILQVRTFFYRMLRASIGRIDEILSPVEPPRKVPWTPDSRSRP